MSLRGFGATVIDLVVQSERGEMVTTLSPLMDPGKREPPHSLDINVMSHNMPGSTVRALARRSVIRPMFVMIHT